MCCRLWPLGDQTVDVVAASATTLAQELFGGNRVRTRHGNRRTALNYALAMS